MDSPEYTDKYSLNQVTSTAKEGLPQKPLKVDVVVEGKEITTELDTGATVSLISKVTFTLISSYRKQLPD